MIEAEGIGRRIELKPYTPVGHVRLRHKEDDAPVSILLPGFQAISGLNIAEMSILRALTKVVGLDRPIGVKEIIEHLASDILNNRNPHSVLQATVVGLNKAIEPYDWRMTNIYTPSHPLPNREKAVYSLTKLQPIYDGSNPEMLKLANEIKNEIKEAHSGVTRDMLREDARVLLGSLNLPSMDVGMSNLRSFLETKKNSDSRLVDFMIGEILPFLYHFGKDPAQEERIDIYQALAVCGIFQIMREDIERIYGEELTDEFRLKIINKIGEKIGFPSKVTKTIPRAKHEDPLSTPESRRLLERTTKDELGDYLKELNILLEAFPDLKTEEYSGIKLDRNKVNIPTPVIRAIVDIRFFILCIQSLKNNKKDLNEAGLLTYDGLAEVLSICKDLLKSRDNSNLFDLREYLEKELIECRRGFD